MAVRAAPLGATAAAARRPPLWLVLGVLVAAITLLPYLYGHLFEAPGRTFMGFFFLGDDANTYLAKMREGVDGSWTWTNRYSTEPSSPVYFFVYWILLGHLAGLLHLDLLLTFHLARFAGAVFLLYAGWLFIEQFVVDVAARRWALCFLALGLGMGYVV